MSTAMEQKELIIDSQSRLYLGIPQNEPYENIYYVDISRSFLVISQQSPFKPFLNKDLS